MLPSEIEQLPDLTGYLKHASDPDWQQVRLEATRRWDAASIRSGLLAADAVATVEATKTMEDCPHE